MRGMYNGKEYLTKIKPNECNDGNGSKHLGLKFFVIGKQTL
jgi:hypothetical protein